MRFKEGDKVIFLNEIGGGVVTRVIDEEIVHVSIEDGFEIPYAVGDLIKEGSDVDNSRTDGFSGRIPAAAKDQKQDKLKIPAHQTDTVQSGIYLAMVPRNQEHPLNSAMDFYLVNHTRHRISFALYQNSGGQYKGVDTGQVEESAKWHLGKVERTDIENWNHALIQALFFQKGVTGVMSPASTHIVFKPLKIYKEESFSFSPLLHQKAMLVLVCET